MAEVKIVMNFPLNKNQQPLKTPLKIKDFEILDYSN